MKFEFKPSFDRSLKALSKEEKTEIKNICLVFLDLLELRVKLPLGVGLKHLNKNYWEIRKGVKSRVLFRWQKDFIEFVLAGDHDSIRRYLKHV